MTRNALITGITGQVGAFLAEFLRGEYLAVTVAHLMIVYSDEAPVNVGCGEELTIRELAERIASVVGNAGTLALLAV